MLDRKSILDARDAKLEKVEVPEWGGSVFVRVLSGTERDAFEASNVRISGKGKDRRIDPVLGNYRARLAVLAVCDEKGERIFSDEDAGAVGKKNAAALDRIVEAAHRINGMGEDSVEVAEKN